MTNAYVMEIQTSTVGLFVVASAAAGWHDDDHDPVRVGWRRGREPAQVHRPAPAAPDQIPYLPLGRG